jgi:serine/threonine protein kinase
MSTGSGAGKGLEKGTMPQATRPGDVLADRYRLVDLLSESGGGRFWRAHDRVLERHVALHVIPADDERADGLLDAARRSATVLDQRILRVLDAERQDDLCFVVNEWGSGTSLDIMLATNGPQSPRRSSWMVAEVADSIAAAHAAGIAHGRLVPENVMIDTAGSIRIIGFCVDAALHGLPPGELRADVVDLAGLLYATLTGRWAGASSSAVPPAPTAGDRVLRPRQVRAGVPRPLDDLCDELLNPKGSRVRDIRDVSSAWGVHRFLTDFVGDPGGLGEAIAAQNPDKHETITLPAVPDIVAWPETPTSVNVEVPATQPRAEPRQEPGPVDHEPADIEPRHEPTVAVAPPAAPGAGSDQEEPAELATEAGLPIFDDENDDVSWLRARADPAPPPPPFEDPPERPLFAPEPSGGAPVRTPRPLQPTPESGRTDDFWPWDGRRGGSTGAVPAPVDDSADDVPGRSWLRLAALVAVALMLLVAVAIAFNLGRGKTPLGAEPEPDTTPSESAASPSPSEAVAITGVTADDFDPQGDPPRDENPDDVGNAVDGDPGTSWSTSTYNQQLGPGGLKTGVGLLLDLGEPASVTEVDLALEGAQTGVSLYVTDQAPTSVDGLTSTAEVTAGPDEHVVLDEPATGRFVLVWLTSLPPTDDGRFRGVVVDVVVKG